MQQQRFARRAGSWLVFMPFLVALGLLASMALYPFTGVGPANNSFALCALAAIMLGLVVGVVALLLAKGLAVWSRLLIAALYLPTALFSLLLAGF